MFDEQKMKEAMTLFCEAVGEDLNDQHIKDTPERCTNMWKVLLGGHDIDPNQYVKLFPNNEGHNPIMVSNINFHGFCAHHVLPFYGQASVCYIPNESLIGLSKLGRILRCFAKRLQVQERLTKNYAEFLFNCELKPLAVFVIIDAHHMCISSRGVRSHGAKTRTIYRCGKVAEGDFDNEFNMFERFTNQSTTELFRY